MTSGATGRILLTGATGGIGRAIAQNLARGGNELVLIATSEERLRDLVERLPQGNHTTIAMDVTDEDAWARVGEIVAEGSTIQGVVTAAAILNPIGSIGSWSIDDFRRCLDVNVTGTLLAVKACVNGMRGNGGSIVTFSGGGGTGPLPRFDAYATSKAAVVRLTENLAQEFKSDGLRINCVAPGFVATGMHEATVTAGPERAGAAYYLRTMRGIENGEHDSPELAADLTAFLLSGESNGITGRLISARWDPWRDARFQERLRADDSFATLRRIDGQFFGALIGEGL